MTATGHTTALVLRWVAVYTHRLDPEVAARRQAELASDLWEQRAHARQVGAPDPLVALSILRRAVAGMPADLHWRHHQLAAAHGRPLGQRRWPMASTRTRALARTWWLVLAALLVPLYVLGAFGIMGLDTSTDPWWPKLWYTGALVMIVGAALIAASLAGRAGSARRWLVALATAAAATIAGLGMGQANAAPVVVVSVMAGAALLAVLAVVGHRRRRSTT
jgi:hypothetical protein